MSGVGRTAQCAWAGVFAFAIASFLTVASPPARAEQIVVSNYGVSPNGMPYAIAMEKGFFKEFGVNVDGIHDPEPAGRQARVRGSGAVRGGRGIAGRRRFANRQR
jgi:ABC-type nitrate/sulfonate/bicarbonate transport system substrate-binding protein